MTALRNGEILAADPHVNEAMLARLRDATPVLSANLNAVTGLGETCLSFPLCRPIYGRKVLLCTSGLSPICAGSCTRWFARKLKPKR